jgi:hypothetical protein
MKKPSQSEIIVRLLLDNRGIWIPSHQLVKQHTKWGYIGTAGSRRAREIAEDGYYILNGVKYFIEVKHGKYAEYRCIGGEKKVQKVEMIEKNGEVVAQIRQEILAL